MINSGDNDKSDVKKKKIKRDYVAVTDNQRQKFLYLHIVLGLDIKTAATEAGVKYENSKQIKKVYLREGRNHKKLYPDYKFKEPTKHQP